MVVVQLLLPLLLFAMVASTLSNLILFSPTICLLVWPVPLLLLADDDVDDELLLAEDEQDELEDDDDNDEHTATTEAGRVKVAVALFPLLVSEVVVWVCLD